MQRGDAALGGALRAEGTDVVGAVVEHLAHQGQPRPWLDGELDPVRALGKPRAPVVARLVLGDQPQLAHLRLERGCALDALDRRGQVDHLAHPRAGLRGGEVGAHPGAQVLGGADVEHPALRVAEEVDPRSMGESLGKVALAALGGADPGGERLELLQGVHTEVAQPSHQAVQHVDRRPGVGERPVVGRRRGAEQGRQRAQLAVGGVVAGDHPARQLRGVEHLEARPRPALLLREELEEAHVEGCVVGDQDAALGELEKLGEHLVDRGCSGDHRVGDAGEHRDERRDQLMRVDQGLELPEHLTAADLHRADLGDHRTGLGGPTRRLQVDDAERDVVQAAAELVEAPLGLPRG